MKKTLFILTFIIGTLPALSAKSDTTQISQLAEIINTSFIEFIKVQHENNRDGLPEDHSYSEIDYSDGDYSAEDSILWNHTTYIDAKSLPVGFEFSDEIKTMGFKIVSDYKNPVFKRKQRVIFMYLPRFDINTNELGIVFIPGTVVQSTKASKKNGRRTHYEIFGSQWVTCMWRYSCEEKKWIYVNKD